MGEKEHKSGQERKEELQERISREIKDLNDTTEKAKREGWY